MQKLLIVVDYQNDFVTGSLGFPEAKRLEMPILNKIKQYETNGDEIIYTLDTHYDDYLETLEGKGLPVVHCIKETEGHALYGRIFDHYQQSTYQKSDVVFKDTFGSADLLKMLIERPQYEQIELVGVVSYMCVLSNAIIAKTAQPEAKIVIDSNCTSGPDQRQHDACLTLMSKSLQMEVI